MASVGRDRWMGIFWLGLLICLMGAVLARCFELQYYHAEESRARAERQQKKIIPQTARRGMIVDREGRTVAMSNEMISVSVDPSFIEDEAAAAEVLAACLSLDERDVLTQLRENRDKQFLRIKRFVSDAEAQTLRALKLKGVILQHEYVRSYPMGPLAGAVVGFTSIDGDGLEGIERRYDKALTGKPGQLLMQMDVHRRPIGWREESEGCEDGLTVAMALDMVIQEIVEKQLEEVVTKYQAAGAVGIVMDPHTGDVLALANWPTFDPSYARQLSADLRRNRVLTDPVEPGSTFKPFTVASALHYGLLKPTDTVFCHNGYYSGRGFGTIREYNYHSYGNLTVAEIIMRSSNIGSAVIAQRVGKQRFYEMIRAFGFGQKTGIDLDGEGEGILRPLSQWNDKDYTLTRVGFGQGISVTPLQLIRGFCCFANGGILVRPRLVNGLLRADGMIVRDFVSEERTRPLRPSDPSDKLYSQVISSQEARAMIDDILLPVVERQGGTAHNAYLENVKIFGKTGTAQIARSDGRGYEPDKYVASFIAGAPAERPKICVLVMVREPNRRLGLGYTGGRVAAPPVKEIIRQTLPYLDEISY